MTSREESKRVLVVEDDPDARALYSEWLAAAGFSIQTAADGAAAVALVTAGRVDAIVMDLQMPEVDGYEATRLIRASSEAPGPYIVAVSAYDGPESRRAAYDAGCDDVLGKPLAPEVLVAIVCAVLRERSRGQRQD